MAPVGEVNDVILLLEGTHASLQVHKYIAGPIEETLRWQ